jgi:hypothetical protein
VFFIQKINSAEGATHGGCLGLTRAVIDSRLQRLFSETDFPGALPQATNEESAPLALSDTCADVIHYAGNAVESVTSLSTVC